MDAEVPHVSDEDDQGRVGWRWRIHCDRAAIRHKQRCKNERMESSLVPIILRNVRQCSSSDSSSSALFDGVGWWFNGEAGFYRSRHYWNHSYAAL